jgi:hypothetical protein
MSLVRRIILGLVTSAGLLLASVVPASAVITPGVPFTVELTGEAEVTPGDLDGIGTATLTINPGTGQVCWTIKVADIDEDSLEAHIHKAPLATNGPIVVPFAPDPLNGCTVVSRELATDIILNPDQYYVNVHNAEFPRPLGALRGQLDQPGL